MSALAPPPSAITTRSKRHVYVEALGLARRFHDEVRARVPEVEPLPEPVPVGPPTLF